MEIVVAIVSFLAGLFVGGVLVFAVTCYALKLLINQAGAKRQQDMEQAAAKVREFTDRLKQARVGKVKSGGAIH